MLASGAIPSANDLAVCKGINHNLYSSVASVTTGHTDFAWVPMGLVVYHGQTGPESLASLVVSGGQRLCHHLGFFVFSLCSFHLFGHIPIIENQINQL